MICSFVLFLFRCCDPLFRWLASPVFSYFIICVAPLVHISIYAICVAHILFAFTVSCVFCIVIFSSIRLSAVRLLSFHVCEFVVITLLWYSTCCNLLSFVLCCIFLFISRVVAPVVRVLCSAFVLSSPYYFVCRVAPLCFPFVYRVCSLMPFYICSSHCYPLRLSLFVMFAYAVASMSSYCLSLYVVVVYCSHFLLCCCLLCSSLRACASIRCIAVISFALSVLILKCPRCSSRLMGVMRGECHLFFCAKFLMCCYVIVLCVLFSCPCIRCHVISFPWCYVRLFFPSH